jgi:hypothetical protein
MSSRECFLKWRTLTIHWIGRFLMIFVMWLWWSIPTEMGRFHHEITMVQWMGKIDSDWKWPLKAGGWNNALRNETSPWPTIILLHRVLQPPHETSFWKEPPKTNRTMVVASITMFAVEITCFCLGLRHHCWVRIITFVRHITVRFCCLNHPPQPNKRDSQPVDQLEGLLQVIFKMSHHLEDQQAGSNYHTSDFGW